jgi:hypothetical protein
MDGRFFFARLDGEHLIKRPAKDGRFFFSPPGWRTKIKDAKRPS